MPVAKQKAITVRLSPDLRRAAERVARQQEQSLNKLIERAVAREVREQEDKDLFDAFTLVGQDTGEADVEFALPAQYEAMHLA